MKRMRLVRTVTGRLSPLFLRLPFTLGRRAVRRGRRLFFFLALDDDRADFAGLEDASLDEPVHEGAVLLLVLVRQGVRVGAQLDGDVLLARLRVALQAG